MKAGYSRFAGILPSLVFFFILLLNLLLTVQLLISLGDSNMEYLFSSDGLYLPSIYRDLFIDKTGLEGWNLNAAPNFFPEWPLYFLIRSLTTGFQSAVLIYAIIQILLFSVLMALIYRIVLEKPNYYFLAVLQVGLTLFLLVYYLNHDFRTISYLFFQGYHNGAVIMALASLSLTLAYFIKPLTSTLVLLFITVLLATVSDRLYIGMYTFPLISLMIFLPYRKLRSLLFHVFVIVGIASFAGLVIFGFLQKGHFIEIISPGSKSMNFQNIRNSLSLFLDHMSGMITHGGPRSWITLITLISCLAGIYIIVKEMKRSFQALRKKSIEGLPDLNRIFMFFASALIIIVILVPIVNGSYIGRAIFRYMIFAFYFAVPFTIFLVYRVSRKWKFQSFTIKYLSLLIVIFLASFVIRNHSLNNTAEGCKELAQYYPQNASTLDKLAKEHNLQYGIASYWHAKHLTMFSKENVRVYCVFDNLHPWFHVTNQNWYVSSGRGKHGNPDFNFIIGNDLNDAGVVGKIFGENTDTLILNALQVYKVPAFRFDKNTRDPVTRDTIPVY